MGLVIIVGVIFGVLLLATCIYVYFIEDDDRIFMQKMIEQNQQHQQNNSDDTHLPCPTIATVDATPPYQSSNQFQENFPQNTNNGEILSPTPLPYSIAPVDVPPPYPGNQSGTWIDGSWMTNQPSNQFQDNFPQNTSHGAIVSSTHLPHPTIATVDATLSYQSSNQFQENFPQNTNHGAIVSSTHLPHPTIATVDATPSYQSSNQFQENFPQNTN